MERQVRRLECKNCQIDTLFAMFIITDNITYQDSMIYSTFSSPLQRIGVVSSLLERASYLRLFSKALARKQIQPTAHR